MTKSAGNAKEYADRLMRSRGHAVQHRTEAGKPCAVCACGWRTDAESYGRRRDEIYQHLDDVLRVNRPGGQ